MSDLKVRMHGTTAVVTATLPQNFLKKAVSEIQLEGNAPSGGKP